MYFKARRRHLMKVSANFHEWLIRALETKLERMSYYSEFKIRQGDDRQGYTDCRELTKDYGWSVGYNDVCCDITPQNIAPSNIYKRIK